MLMYFGVLINLQDEHSAALFCSGDTLDSVPQLNLCLNTLSCSSPDPQPKITLELFNTFLFIRLGSGS